MKNVKITNADALKKIDRTKPHAFEMIVFEEGEIVCTAYITTAKQWQRFVNNFVGEWLQVCDVHTETNTAVILCV